MIAGNPDRLANLEKVLSQYKNAGRSSISWGVINKSIRGEEIEQILTEAYGTKLFSDELRPEVTRDIQLNRAEWQNEEKTILRLEFVVAGKIRLEYQFYNLVEIAVMKIVDCFLKVYEDQVVVEVRAPLNAEFDLIFNVTRYQETHFHKFSDLMIVECKNWTTKPGAKEIRSLETKMDEIKSSTAIFFSKNGITGRDYSSDAKGVICDSWIRKNQVIMVITLEDVIAVVEKKISLYSLLGNKFNDIRIL